MRFFSNIHLDMMPGSTNFAPSLRAIVFCLFTVFGTLSSALEPIGSYFDWGRGQDGNTYCYQLTGTGLYMNEGNPVDNWYCK